MTTTEKKVAQAADFGPRKLAGSARVLEATWGVIRLVASKARSV
jgi:hypothetical protein